MKELIEDSTNGSQQMSVFTRKSKPAHAAVAVANGRVGSDLSHLTGDYIIDPAHSRIGFTVRHAMVTNVRGEFTEYEGKLYLDGSDPAKSRAEVVIKVASIDTNSPSATSTCAPATSSPPTPTQRSPSARPPPNSSTATATGCMAT